MANNPYVNKVVKGTDTLIDLTADTVTANSLMQGYTAHDKSGAPIVGTATGGGTDAGTVTQDPDGYLVLDDDSGGKYDPSDATATAADILSPKTAYISGGKVTGSIVTKSSSDLTASGATVTVPSGYYATAASKSVASGSATPAASISATGATVTAGTNTLTFSKSVSNTPQVSAGYISAGSSGNTSVSLTASIDTRSSSDLTASNLTVTAPSGYYASNATKTLSDEYLLAENIKKNITIFGVTGSFEGGGGLEYEEGTWTPAEDVTDYTISFANTHTKEPFYYSIINSDTNFVNTPYTNTFQHTTGFKNGSIWINSTQQLYAQNAFLYTNSSGSGSTTSYQTVAASTSYSDYFKKTGIRAYTNSSSRYWRTGITYKWIAVWAPTS